MFHEGQHDTLDEQVVGSNKQGQKSHTPFQFAHVQTQIDTGPSAPQNTIFRSHEFSFRPGAVRHVNASPQSEDDPSSEIAARRVCIRTLFVAEIVCVTLSSVVSSSTEETEIVSNVM